MSTLQMVIASPAALCDPYAAVSALDEVVNVTKEEKDERQCRPLLNNPCRLVASKEEAEMAKVIAKETKRPVPAN